MHEFAPPKEGRKTGAARDTKPPFLTMVSPPTPEEDERKLYLALIKGKKKEVLELCQKFSDGPFHVVTIHGDTVLHVATSTKQADLVLKLLELVSNDQLDKLTLPNKIGNTILHEASTSDKLIQAAEEMLNKAPELLYMRNDFDETPLYRSVLLGRMDIFKFFHGKIRRQKQLTHQGDREADSEIYYHNHRTNKTTILHVAVVTESFGVLTDHEEKSTASEDESTEDITQKEAGCCGVPYWETIQEERETYEDAVKLASFLIKEDTSWRETRQVESRHAPKYHSYEGQDPSEKKQNEQKLVPIAETPLFLAIKHGCFDIVKEILEVYPLAVEHIDYQGRTILHVAIKYRQMQVLDLVEQMGLLVKRLERKIDRRKNTILHMVGEKTEDRITPELRSPAFELQENLLVFERVKELCPGSLRNTLNEDKKTAQKLFDKENEELHKKARDWLQRTAEHCSIVAVLIATVAFTAAYTIPGGPNQSTGFPLLLNQPLFVVFTLTDVLSLTFSLTSVIFFLRILTSSFRLKEFKQSLPQNLMLAVTFLILSISMMMFAFAATVILMIHERESWTKVALYSSALLPVTIFTFSYMPLYLSLMKTSNYSLKKVAMILPRFPACPHKSEPKQIKTSNSTYTSKPKASPNIV